MNYQLQIIVDDFRERIPKPIELIDYTQSCRRLKICETRKDRSIGEKATSIDGPSHMSVYWIDRDIYINYHILGINIACIRVDQYKIDNLTNVLFTDYNNILSLWEQ